MTAPVAPIGTPPLSPTERDQITDSIIEAVNAWRYSLQGIPPREDDFIRLFLRGMREAREARKPEHGQWIDTRTIENMP